jgi:hypothetical protein
MWHVALCLSLIKRPVWSDRVLYLLFLQLGPQGATKMFVPPYRRSDRLHGAVGVSEMIQKFQG